MCDDATIADDVELWRRLNPEWVLRDPEQGSLRITSAAFQNYPGADALSICISCDVPEGFSPADYVASHDGFGVAGLLAGEGRAAGQAVKRVPEENEVAHGHLVGRKPKSVKKALARAARLLIPPDPPPPSV